jgi:hypothetical protein
MGDGGTTCRDRDQRDHEQGERQNGRTPDDPLSPERPGQLGADRSASARDLQNDPDLSDPDFQPYERLLRESLDGLAVDRVVAGPDAGYVVRAGAAIQRVDHSVVRDRDQRVVPGAAVETIGAATGVEPVRPAAAV